MSYIALAHVSTGDLATAALQNTLLDDLAAIVGGLVGTGFTLVDLLGAATPSVSGAGHAVGAYSTTLGAIAVSIEGEVYQDVSAPCETVTIGENVTARQLLRLATGSILGETLGRAYKADATYTSKSTFAYVLGFARAAYSAAALGRVQVGGVMGGFSGLVAGTPYYLSGTPGAITATAPANAVLVGVAISTTQLSINMRGAQASIQTTVTSIYGYMLGGDTGAAVATTDRITFVTGTTAAAVGANLSTARIGAAGFGDKVTYGYALGGSAPSAVSDRITFSSSTTGANAGSNLSVARGYVAGLSDGTTYGYALGGESPTKVVTGDRTTFSTSVTAANAGSNLSTVRTEMGQGLSDGATYGYTLGGTSGTVVAVADRVTFSTSGTAANAGSNLSGVRRFVATISDNATYGYALGGDTGSSNTNTTDRVTFSTSGTAAYSTANLGAGRTDVLGISDGSIYGYILGGYTGAFVTTAERLTFATGAVATQGSAVLSAARGDFATASDAAV